MIKSAVIATHSFAPGTSQALYAYMKRQNYDVMFIEHKLFGSPLSWSIGALDTFWKVLVQPHKYDLFVGSNRLNAFVGILLKCIGKVKKVVYFSPDWVESRLPLPILNNLYQSLDYFCVKYADQTWNSSAYMDPDPMMKERDKRGYPKDFLKKQIQVPDGTDPMTIKPFAEINRHKIGFVGHIKEGMGLEMLVESFRTVRKKFPQAKLLMIGSGPILDDLKKQAKDLPVIFTGFMGDINQVYKELADCAFAVAPYEQETISQYTDPGKVKVYFSVGLPVIISHVPLISREVHQTNSGIAIGDNHKELTAAIELLLSNDELLLKMRHNVLGMRKKYSWDSIFTKALQSL